MEKVKYYRRKDGLRYLMVTQATAGQSLEIEHKAGKITTRVSNVEWGTVGILEKRLENYEECTYEQWEEARQGKVRLPGDEPNMEYHASSKI